MKRNMRAFWNLLGHLRRSVITKFF